MKYGWDTNANKNARARTANGNELLDNLILFPPDKASKWCSGDDDSTVSCEPNKWKIEIENGKYRVKVTFGDSEIAARHDLNLNGAPIFGNFLMEDQFETWESEELTILNSEIKLSSSCPPEAATQCKYSWSRVSAIEIEALEYDEEAASASGNFVPLGCGETITGP